MVPVDNFGTCILLPLPPVLCMSMTLAELNSIEHILEVYIRPGQVKLTIAKTAIEMKLMKE